MGNRWSLITDRDDKEFVVIKGGKMAVAFPKVVTMTIETSDEFRV